MTGIIGILNVGAGDTKLSFDPSNPQERIRAARIVRDMIRRGYALLVDTGVKDGAGRPVYRRAYDFDEERCEYIIADFDPIAGQPEENADAAASPKSPAEASPETPGRQGRRGRPRKRVDAGAVHAVAVSRSAGG